MCEICRSRDHQRLFQNLFLTFISKNNESSRNIPVNQFKSFVMNNNIKSTHVERFQLNVIHLTFNYGILPPCFFIAFLYFRQMFNTGKSLLVCVCDACVYARANSQCECIRVCEFFLGQINGERKRIKTQADNILSVYTYSSRLISCL